MPAHVALHVPVHVPLQEPVQLTSPMIAHMPVQVALHEPWSSPWHSTCALPMIEASHSAAQLAATSRSTVHDAGVIEMPSFAPTGRVDTIVLISVATRLHAAVTSSSVPVGFSSLAGIERSVAIDLHAVSMSVSTDFDAA
jgi:hypothetical protein